MISKIASFFKTQLMYDLRPWMCLAIGIASIRYERHATANLLLGSMLMLCAISIFVLRMGHRRSAVRVQVKLDQAQQAGARRPLVQTRNS